MLNKTAKLTLVATSLAPVCLTLWFVEFSKAWDWQAGLKYLLVASLLSLLCAFLVRLSGKNLEKLPVKIKAAKTTFKGNADSIIRKKIALPKLDYLQSYYTEVR